MNVINKGDVMKLKKIFFIFLFILLFFNCESAYAKLKCSYQKAGRYIDIIVDKGEISVYNNKKLVNHYLQFEITEEGGCPKEIYTSGKNNIYIFDAQPSVSSGVSNYHDRFELNSQITNAKVSCGSGQGMVTGIPKKIPELTSFAITVVQVAVPVILVIMGAIDLFKGITAQKEDEMKKGQQMFIKRLAVGAIIFLIVIVVKFIISIVADTNQANIVDCIDCFVSNACGKE